MSPTPRDRWRGLIQVAAPSLAALGPSLLLAPLAISLARGLTGPRRTVLVLLLLETTYLLAGSICLGASGLRGKETLRGAAFMGIAWLGCLLTLAWEGGGLKILAASQSAAAAAWILGWGCGRAARETCGRGGPATAMASLAVAALGAGLLPLSHLSGPLGSWPRAGEILLAADPYVAVTHGAGYDLIRSPALYEELSISGHRFQYPGPILAPLVLAGLGLLLSRLRKTRRTPSLKAQAPITHSSREVSV